jgi:hypothetical protein
VLFGFWWIGFTPLRIPRYFWYTAAVGAAFGGATAGALLSNARTAVATPGQRRWAVTFAILLLGAYGLPLARTAGRVYALDQAAPDRALIEYVSSLPASTRVATSYWPVERLISFSLERPVELWDQTGPRPSDMVFIARDPDMGDDESESSLRFEPYRVYEGPDARTTRLAQKKGD